MQNAQQVTDFRAKLIASGFFSSITVEEQTPIQNQPESERADVCAMETRRRARGVENRPDAGGN